MQVLRLEGCIGQTCRRRPGSELEQFEIKSGSGQWASSAHGVDWLVSGCNRCYRGRHYFFHSRFVSDIIHSALQVPPAARRSFCRRRSEAIVFPQRKSRRHVTVRFRNVAVIKLRTRNIFGNGWIILFAKSPVPPSDLGANLRKVPQEGSATEYRSESHK